MSIPCDRSPIFGCMVHRTFYTYTHMCTTHTTHSANSAGTHKTSHTQAKQRHSRYNDLEICQRLHTNIDIFIAFAPIALCIECVSRRYLGCVWSDGVERSKKKLLSIKHCMHSFICDHIPSTIWECHQFFNNWYLSAAWICSQHCHMNTHDPQTSQISRWWSRFLCVVSHRFCCRCSFAFCFSLLLFFSSPIAPI